MTIHLLENIKILRGVVGVGRPDVIRVKGLACSSIIGDFLDVSFCTDKMRWAKYRIDKVFYQISLFGDLRLDEVVLIKSKGEELTKGSLCKGKGGD